MEINEYLLAIGAIIFVVALKYFLWRYSRRIHNKDGFCSCGSEALVSSDGKKLCMDCFDAKKRK